MDKFNLIIPAAGAATRLRPLSSNTSKIMVRVNGKPCLDYIVESVVDKVNEIIIVDGQFTDIREYCAIKHPNIKFVKQGSLNGPRDAIKIGMNEIQEVECPVVVWLGDAIILEKDLPFGTDFLLTKQVDNHSAWCMWDGSKYYNKPTTNIQNASALVGLYSFSNARKAIAAFNNTEDYDISAALELYSNRYENVNTNKWYDIGDLPNYYKTCATLLNLKARAFNNLEFDQELSTICKSPDYHNAHSVQTLNDEIQWYKSLTPQQSMFVPRILPSDTQLIMSYESGTLLSDLMLYDNLANSSWDYILDKVFNIKLKYFNNKCYDSEFLKHFSAFSKSIWIDKSTARLKDTNLKAESKTKLETLANNIWKKTRPISGMHGDLHFANILYNQQTDQLKLIDPRGNYGGYSGSNGDNVYDWAKLAHDLYHGYNSIVSNVPHNKYVKSIFVKKLKEYDLPVEDILNGGLLLLATCIPLHSDDPQRQIRMTNYIESQL